MKKRLITTVILSFICMSTGCSGATVNEAPAVSTQSRCDTGITAPKDIISDPAEDIDTLGESLRMLTIEDNVVTDCISFATGIIVIPDNVTAIGDNAFEGCDGITGIKVPKSVEEIGFNAFLDCTSLKTLELSEGLKQLKSSAFDGCTALDEVSLPDSLEIVFEGVFGNSDVTLIYKGKSYTAADNISLCKAVCYDENA